MAIAGPYYCACGLIVQAGARCPCKLKSANERKARHDETRPSARQRGYSKSWERERALFLNANPTCRHCGAPATVVDHVIAHKGDMRLFWDRSNLMSLCAHCHNSWKQSQEKRNR